MVTSTAYRPTALTDALAFLAENAAQNPVIFAGGTDLMVRHRGYSGTLPRIDRSVLFVDAVEELTAVSVNNDGTISIGAAASYSDILSTDGIPELVAQAIGLIAATGLRNRGTLGGNICNASPAADSVPPLLIHEAVCRIASIDGERIVRLDDFATGPGKTVLKPGELLAAVEIPPYELALPYYRKVGTRRANALSKLSVCGGVFEGAQKKEIRIAMGAVGPKAIRLPKTEAAMIKQSEPEEILKNLYDEIAPISDQRSTAGYRNAVAGNCVIEFYEHIIAAGNIL